MSKFSIEEALKNTDQFKSIPYGVEFSKFMTYLDKFTKIEYVRIVASYEVPLNGWENFTELKGVTCAGFKGKEGELKRILSAISKAPQVRKLEIGEGNYQLTLPDLSGFKNLEELNIGYNHHLNAAETFQQLAEQVPNLTHLNIRNLKLGEIPEELFLLKKLQSINFTTNYFKKLPLDFADLPDLKEVILGAKNNFWIPKDMEKVFKDFPKLTVEERRFLLVLGEKNIPEINWTWSEHRIHLINALNSSSIRIRNRALSIIEQLFVSNFAERELKKDSRVIFVGKIEGSKTDYKEKLKALQIKVDTKISAAITHIILGEKPAKKTEQLYDTTAAFMTETHFNEFLESADQLFLKEENSESIGKNLTSLLGSMEETNEEMAIMMMKKGGVPTEAMNDLYLVYQFSKSEKNRRNAGKLLKQYCSTTLRERLVAKNSMKKSRSPIWTASVLSETTELSQYELVSGMFRRNPDYRLRNYLMENGSDKVRLEVLQSQVNKNNELGLQVPLEKYIHLVKQLPNVESIVLQIKNPIDNSKLFDALKQLKDLKGISISNARLKIPNDAFEGLDKLERLTLWSWSFTEIPQAILKVSSLKMMSLRSNKITEIPQEILHMQNLEIINLTSNKLIEFPLFLQELPNLRAVHLNDMPDMKEIPETKPTGWYW